MNVYKLLNKEQREMLVEDRAELLMRISRSRDVGMSGYTTLVFAVALALLCIDVANSLLIFNQ